MAENLAYLPQVSKPSATIDSNAPLYFVLNYDGEDVSAAKATEEFGLYGVLYNWYAAMGQADAQGGDAEANPFRDLVLTDGMFRVRRNGKSWKHLYLCSYPMLRGMFLLMIGVAKLMNYIKMFGRQ